MVGSGVVHQSEHHIIIHELPSLIDGQVANLCKDKESILDLIGVMVQGLEVVMSRCKDGAKISNTYTILAEIWDLRAVGWLSKWRK